MNKQRVDEIITEYMPKIYGFAVKKTFSYDEAEELSADIVKEVYYSLLKADDVLKVEGYIWRISEHVFAKYVSQVKKQQGVSIDGLIIPSADKYFFDNNDDEISNLRREIAYLSSSRRKIVYSFYFENKSIKDISYELNIPEGTVKWHLNKARNELKEGIFMERKIGKLGINPKESCSIAHGGTPGANGGPEVFFNDKLNLNIVYSVYHEPKTREEIAQELGVTPLIIEDKIDSLEKNGFLVPLSGGKYTTYVSFSPEDFSGELFDKMRQTKQIAAELIASEYVPQILQAIEKMENVYIPSGNMELFAATAVWMAITDKCKIQNSSDVSKYFVKTLDGGNYITYIDLATKVNYQDREPEKMEKVYSACGVMTRGSAKYSPVYSWSVDSRFCSREGGWQNNWNYDYEIVYELVNGILPDNISNTEKYARLRERKFINDNNQVMIMMYKGLQEDFLQKLPQVPEGMLKKIGELTIENAMMAAKFSPPQMQDLIVFGNVDAFFDSEVAMRVMDILYDNGIFKPLTEDEKITSQLIMFSDVLPE